MESRIFRGQRALGFVCNEVPLQTRYIRKHRDTFILTVVGRSFHTYSVRICVCKFSGFTYPAFLLQTSKLHLYSTSEFHPSDIVCLAADPRFVYTACHEDVRVFKRGVHAEVIHPFTGVRLLLPFGELLICVADNTLTAFVRDSGGKCLCWFGPPAPECLSRITTLSLATLQKSELLAFIAAARS